MVGHGADKDVVEEEVVVHVEVVRLAQRRDEDGQQVEEHARE